MISSDVLVLHDVSVVDVAAGEVHAGQSIVITGGLITAVRPAREVTMPAKARYVNGAGRFVIPGLWDMHTHVLGDWEDASILLVANGVTGIRNLHSTIEDPLARVLDIKAALRRGQIRGPELVANGPIVDGPQPVWNSSVAVGTPEQGVAAVRMLRDRGADFIKVYSLLSPDCYFAIAEEANRLGIPFDGHVPAGLTLREASNAGQRCIEHMNFFVESCSPNELEIHGIIGAFYGAIARNDPSAFAFLEDYYRAVADGMDVGIRDDLIERLVNNGTWVCPTLVTLLPYGLLDAQNPAFAYVRPAAREAWSREFQDAEQRKGVTWDLGIEHYRIMEDLLRQAQASGLNLIAGTDVGNPFLVPGFSLHDELELYVKAGLSPADALRTATVNPARMLGRDDLGLVEVGYQADLVLLERNPLEDISATRQIGAVVLNGEWINRTQLDAMLESVRLRVSESPQR